MTYLTIKEAKAQQALTDIAIDKISKVEIKEEFFDDVIWVRPKALLIKKGNKQCWVGRSVIIKTNNFNDENPNDPKSIEVYAWVELAWQPIKKGVEE